MVMELERMCILEQAKACLRSSCYQSLGHLECQYEEEQLVICGTVPSYYFKQLAQELVRRGCPTARVSNAVAVRVALCEDVSRQLAQRNSWGDSEASAEFT